VHGSTATSEPDSPAYSSDITFVIDDLALLRGVHSLLEVMPQSLADHSMECAQLFDTLLQVLENAPSPPLKQTTVEDQYVRFKIWAGNLGAFQQLPSTISLDYRLRNSRRISDHVESLLLDLLTGLQDGKTRCFSYAFERVKILACDTL
jgi:hypothetical protein